MQLIFPPFEETVMNLEPDVKISHSLATRSSIELPSAPGRRHLKRI